MRNKFYGNLWRNQACDQPIYGDAYKECICNIDNH